MRWAVVIHLDTLGALAVLDAADTVGVGVVLLLGRDESAKATAQALVTATAESTADIEADCALLRPPASEWCVVGIGPEPSPTLALLTELAVGGSESLPAPRESVGGRRVSHRFLAIVAATAAAALAAGGAAAWQLTHRAVSPGRSLLAGLAPCTGGPVTTASSPPSVPDGASVVSDDAPGLGGQVVVREEGSANTWLWSGQRWHLAHPAANPSARGAAATAYDPVTLDVLLFGGSAISSGASVGMNDTWAWNGCTWARLASSGQPPPAWLAPVMTWDRSTHQMLLVTAGAPSGSFATQTWIWDGSGWTPAANAAQSPAAGELVAAFDPALRTVIAVRLGGDDNNPSAPSTTWAWEGSHWKLLHPAHPPAVDSPAALVTDPLTNRLLLVGPSRVAGGPDELTWRWDGQDWAPLQPHDWPAAFAAVDDRQDGVAELFGWANPGPSANPTLGVWAWGGSTWVRLADGSVDTRIPGASPPARQFASTAYDTNAHQLVLFGGHGAAPGVPSATPLLNTPLQDTWTFDGKRWTRISSSRHPPAAGPNAPAAGDMAFDPAGGTILLVDNQQTWSWNGTSWQVLQPRGEIAGSDQVAAMAPDPATRTVVALTVCCGGTELNSALHTWTWEGRSWSLQDPPGALPAGLEFVMAYDPATHFVLAVGTSGTVGPAATWMWDGTTWFPQQTQNAAIFDPVTATIASDPQNRTVVLVTTIAGVQHTAIWNGRTWVDHSGSGPLGADTGYETAAMYYDDVIGQIVLLSSSDDDFSEEWMWTGEVTTRA